MRYARALFVAWLPLALGCQEAAGPPASGQEVIFTAQVSQLARQQSPIARGRAPDDSVQLQLPGEAYDPPLPVEPLSRDSIDRSDPVNALASLWSAYLADDADQILASWAAVDRDRIARSLDDPEARARNREALAAYDQLFVHALAELPEDTTFLLITYEGQDRSRGFVETFVRDGPHWRATRALSDDARRDLVWAAFRSGGMEERPGEKR